ncbi:PGPGW domain-containing protein [Actinomadura parmotrematis]|uniref:PGPGW domain-containing protein n=1 Tax=Actinomadura parmotrematis TaxID=2864039 RepID=UPI0027E229CE|nr:PGPGW domain-containing protein [Actinomadura parmotrematis]
MATKQETDDRPSRLARFRERIRRNRLLDTTWRVGVFSVGATLLAGGLVMMVTPGPGFLGIILGLAVLATEFAWAQRALHKAKEAAERAKEKALDPRRRRRNTILSVLGGVLVAAAILAFLVVYDFHLPWNIQDWTPWN